MAKRTFKVWMQLGFGLHGAYIVQVSQYKPDQDSGRAILFPWQSATLVLSPPKKRARRK